MYYNWEFILQDYEEDRKPTGVIVEDYELIVRVLKGETAIRPVVSVCDGFKGVSEEALAKANLTLVENVFMEYALVMAVGQTEQAEAYLDLQQKLKPIAIDYSNRVDAVRKFGGLLEYAWFLDIKKVGDSILEEGRKIIFSSQVNENYEFVLSMAGKTASRVGVWVTRPSSPLDPSKLDPNTTPPIVRRFYEMGLWIESNPRQLTAFELLLDEVARIEKENVSLEKSGQITSDAAMDVTFPHKSSGLKNAWHLRIAKRTDSPDQRGIKFNDWCFTVSVTPSTTPGYIYEIEPGFKLTEEELKALAENGQLSKVGFEFLLLARNHPPKEVMESELLRILKKADEDFCNTTARRSELISQFVNYWVVQTVPENSFQSKYELLRINLKDGIDFIVECLEPEGAIAPGCLIKSYPDSEDINWAGLPPLVIDYLQYSKETENEAGIPYMEVELLTQLLEMDKNRQHKQMTQKPQHCEYSYLVVFQDLMAPQSTPLACRWVGSFEVQDLYNVAVYRAPATSFSLMFAMDSNVKLDAVRAGAQGVGLAAKLSKLAVTQDYHTYREWSAVTEQLRACFE